MANSQTYFVRRMGRVEGPWPLEKLHSEVRLRKLGRYHEVSVDGQSWSGASEFEVLFPSSNVRKVVGRSQEDADVAVTEAHVPVDAEAMDDEVWYCYVQDQEQGPMTLAALSELARSESLSLEDLVWREEYPDWIPAEQVPELAPAFNLNIDPNAYVTADATRMVEVGGADFRAKFPMISLISGAVLLFLSCVPFVGFLGLAPIVMASMAIVQIRKEGQGQMGYAITGLSLGIAAVLFGVIALIGWILGFSYFLGG